MFQSAVIKLTAWYVGALLVVSIFFSIPTYIVASNRLADSALRQFEIIQGLRGPFTPPVVNQLGELREQQLYKDRMQLLKSIILANVIIILLGAYFSYRFAKKTLEPIEEAHNAQARFTTDASHELRTPLATMQTEIEVALRSKKLGASQARSVLSSNLEEIARLRTLSDELLSLARLDTTPLNKKKLNFSSLVQSEVKALNKRHAMKISSTQKKNIYVSGDERLLRQPLSILVDNAVKYSNDTDNEVKIDLSHDQNEVKLKVTDKGIGITPTDLPNIFDRFYRSSEATKHAADGQGLGLSLAKKIAEAHNGEITVDSIPGKGSTFTVSLSLA